MRALWTRLALAGAVALVALIALPGCASVPAGADSRYPPRGAGCEIAVYHTAVPGTAVWDDLGIAEVACHVSSPLPQCLRRLKAEGCRMGGDIIYNVPRSPLRPQDQVMVLRGQVAHSLPGNPRKESEEQDLPPPASKEESAGPVVPLTGAAAPGAPAAPPVPAAAPPAAPPDEASTAPAQPSPALGSAKTP